MIILDDATSKLQLTTSAAETVNVVVSYVDRVDAPHREQYRSQETAITTATTTDILAVPSDGRRRQVLQVVVTSLTGTSVCTLKKDVNGTDYQIGGAVSLAVGEWMVVDANGVFYVYEADGDLKVKVGAGGGGGGDALTTDPLSQFAATTSAQLAGVISDETGTGALVFANTPTLVTPVLGTPGSGTLTNCTGLPISTGVSGLAANVATALATPSSANIAAACTDETGTGALVFANTPTLVTPVLGTPTSGTLTNCTGLPISTGVSGLAANVATALATPSSANIAAACTDETGTGALVFANTPTLVTPVLGTPGSGTLTNCTGLPVTTGLTAGNWKVLSSDGSGNVDELALGAQGTVLQSQGASAAPAFGRAWTIVLKTADESRVNNTILNDSTLVLALSASTTYRIRGRAYYALRTNSSQDFQYQFAYSGTTSGDLLLDLATVTAGTSAGTAAEIQGVVTAYPAATSILSGATGIGRVEWDTILTTNASGTWSFKWAQNTTQAGAACDVLKGSTLEWMIIA